MHRHQGYARVFFVLVGVRHQCRVIDEIAQAFALLFGFKRCGAEFFDVQEPRFGFVDAGEGSLQGLLVREGEDHGVEPDDAVFSGEVGDPLGPGSRGLAIAVHQNDGLGR